MISEPPKRGELYFADLEDIGQKLVLVVSPDDVNELLNPVVCLVTSTERERSLETYVQIDPPEGGVWKPSTILCHAILTLERWRLAPEALGSVSATTQESVDECLCSALGIDRHAPTQEGAGADPAPDEPTAPAAE